MIAFDTNVLVRYIVQDDPDQAAAAGRLIENGCSEQSPGYVALPVLMELSWVLDRHYKYPKTVVISVIRQLLRTAVLAVEDRVIVGAALREYETGGADFADYLIAHRNHAKGCSTTYTFDRRASQGRHFELIALNGDHTQA